MQIQSIYSTSLPCGNLGAPQGSVLAGLLQNIHCNDFPACHSNSEAASGILFVDDESDNVHAQSEEALYELLQGEVDISLNWLSDNRLCTAPDKSKFMIIGNSHLRKH